MSSTVYMTGMHSRSQDNNKLAKINRLCDAINLKKIIKKDDLCAVKIHFGEYGNDTHIKPVFARCVIDKIRKAGGNPFLTDSTTLYSGMRHNAVDHMNVAYMHGFSPATVNAPIIIADGLFGKNDVAVRINKKHFEEVFIADAIRNAPSMIVMSHFKGHEMAGFGGAIKNLAMGGGSVRGKREQHGTHVQIEDAKCVGCGRCVKVCPQKALYMEDQKSHLDVSKCIGCFECITVCPSKAISIDWTTEIIPFMERMTEYAYGVVKGREKRIGYINFVVNVTPDCDCVSWSDAFLVPDIGILASTDPVALDQACYDLICTAKSLDPKLEGVSDKFRARWPHTRGDIQLIYGEQVGLGKCEYKLEKI